MLPSDDLKVSSHPSDYSSLTMVSKSSHNSPFGYTVAFRVFAVIFTSALLLYILFRHEITLALSSSGPDQCILPQEQDRDSYKPIGSTTRVFGTNTALTEVSAAGDAAWAKEFETPKGGFLWVRHNESVVEGWGISMLHALHCLSMLRQELKQYWSAKEAMAFQHKRRSQLGNHASHRDHDRNISHLKHCLGYIAEVWGKKKAL